MVGVPGKSKGCSTCRRRKKGCDQRRPICGQCASSGYVCGGYQRELNFVIHPSSKTARKAYYIPHSAQQPSLSVAPSLDRSAIDKQCRALFWDLYLPHGKAEASGGMLARCDHLPNWTSVLLELSQEETALDLAFSALSVGRVGRSNHDYRLVKESTKIYGHALKNLQKALDDASRMRSEEVLAACSLLGLYEVFEGGDTLHKSVGWVSHAQGAARLVELRGPSLHITRQAHHVFLGARLPILYSAIVRRKRTFLAEEDWLTIPWRDMPCKTYHDVLIDHCTKIPGLLERFDQVRANHTEQSHRTGSKLLEQLQDLKELLLQWDSRKSQGSRPILVDHSFSAGDKYPFEHDMWYRNHLFFNASLIYWSAQIIMSTTISQLELYLASLGFARPQMYASTTSSQQQARQFATCIVQSIPYALMPDMGALGLSHINFPICLAFQHFTASNEDQICAWLVKVSSDMREQGIRLRSFTETNTTKEEHSIMSMEEQKMNSPVAGGISVEAVRSKYRNEADADSEKTGGSSAFRTEFIYENPAKYYIDSTASDR